MKHLLKMLDLSKEEILDILNLADQLKYENKNSIEHHIVAYKEHANDPRIDEVCAVYPYKSFF